MIKPTVKRGLLLDFIPPVVSCPLKTDYRRVFKLNDGQISEGDVTYFMTREYRVEDNWGLNFAQEIAKKYNKKFNITVFINNNYYSNHQESFLLENIKILRQNFERNNLNYKISESIPKDYGVIITDFNPINIHARELKNYNCPCFEVDSHNITPARIVSDKQEYSAATLRRKIYSNITEYMTEFPKFSNILQCKGYEVLRDFIENKLHFYAQEKNNPLKDVTSKLSPYLHFGFISPQRVALEVLASGASRENKEIYLEELIVRKELADNFCLYNYNYKSLLGAPSWAKSTLDEHKVDIRNYTYDINQFEYAKTHDKLWNIMQEQLLNTGRLHGYLRMYWAKKILEWSESPEEALKIAIYLNDKYALDGMDENGYVGILWAIGGLHDRPFTNRFVIGKIRNMGLSACKRNFDIKKYLED